MIPSLAAQHEPSYKDKEDREECLSITFLRTQPMTLPEECMLVNGILPYHLSISFISTVEFVL